MKTPQLRDYQTRAVHAIIGAVYNQQRIIVLEMVLGTGKSAVLVKVIDQLLGFMPGKILVIASSTTKKLQLESILLTNASQFEAENIIVETQQNLYPKGSTLRSSLDSFKYIFFFDVIITKKLSQLPFSEKNQIIIITGEGQKQECEFSDPKNVVFTYGYDQAIREGRISPSMDEDFLLPTINLFCKKFFALFGYFSETIKKDNKSNCQTFISKDDGKKINIIYKAYKTSAVSQFTATALLNDTIMKRMSEGTDKEEITLLIFFNNIPSLQKDVIFEKFGIMIWDIENLIFYSQGDSYLLKLLSQICYFAIGGIEGKTSPEAEAFGLKLSLPEPITQINEAADSKENLSSLAEELKACEPGAENYAKYEDICERIIRSLFDESFNRLINQYKTEDEHFRMDLIGSLKINNESIHTLWKMFIQHYNSHFIIFEFKNYAKEIDQNLIYITEKYLFNAALRNVAIIVSRKGFSDSAKFASQGCLKENGKLILDITDEDLLNMLTAKANNDEPADIILNKFEDFLMSISK